MWKESAKSMECKTINLFLYPLSSEVSQRRIADEINGMEERGWSYVESKIIVDCNIMLTFKR